MVNMQSCTVSCAVTIGASVSLIVYLLSLLRKPKYKVKDKVVLITGASSGLGEACAHAFYKSGAKVILCARRTEELERVQNDLINLSMKNPHKPKVLTMDLINFELVSSKVSEALDMFGTIDVLVNNAGIGSRGDIVTTTIDVHQNVMNLNYFGQVAIITDVVQHMLKSGTGHILVVSSVQGKLAIPYSGAYGASKHAIQAFCDSLRAELWNTKIKVSVMSPGYIKTNLSLNALQEDGTSYGMMDPNLQKGYRPEEVADSILQAVEYQKDEVWFAPFDNKLGIVLRNILPGVFSFVMKMRAKNNSDKTAI